MCFYFQQRSKNKFYQQIPKTWYFKAGAGLIIQLVTFFNPLNALRNPCILKRYFVTDVFVHSANPKTYKTRFSL